MKKRNILVAILLIAISLAMFSQIHRVGAVNSDTYIDARYVDPTKIVLLTAESESWTKGSFGNIYNDTVNFKSAPYGLKLVSNQTAEASATRASRTETRNLTGYIERVWIYVDNVSNLGGIEFYFGNDSAYTTFKYYNCSTSPKLETGWNLLGMPFSNNALYKVDTWTNLSTWRESMMSAIASRMIKVWSATTSNVSVTFDEWIGYANLLPYGAVTFTFDDGRNTTSETVKGMMDLYGFKGVAGIITNSIGSASPTYDYMNWSQVQNLVNDGWDAGSHGANHLDMTGLSLASIDYELSASRSALDGNLSGNKGSRFWFEPFYAWNDTVLAEIEKYYNMSSLTNRKFSSVPPASMYNIERYTTSNTTTANEMIEAIKNATFFGDWLVINLHTITSGNVSLSTFMSNATFHSILDYCFMNGVSVRTYSDVFDFLVTTLTFRIGAGGSLDVNGTSVSNSTLLVYDNATTVIHLSALPNVNFTFVNFTWNGVSSSSNPYDFTVTNTTEMSVFFTNASTTPISNSTTVFFVFDTSAILYGDFSWLYLSIFLGILFLITWKVHLFGIIAFVACTFTLVQYVTHGNAVGWTSDLIYKALVLGISMSLFLYIFGDEVRS